MSLEDQIKQTLDDFENTPSEKIFEILNQIKPQFKSELISEYLQGKIKKILEVNDLKTIKIALDKIKQYSV